MKTIFILLFTLFSSLMFSQEYIDDIYYYPKDKKDTLIKKQLTKNIYIFNNYASIYDDYFWYRNHIRNFYWYYPPYYYYTYSNFYFGIGWYYRYNPYYSNFWSYGWYFPHYYPYCSYYSNHYFTKYDNYFHYNNQNINYNHRNSTVTNRITTYKKTKLIDNKNKYIPRYNNRKTNTQKIIPQYNNNKRTYLYQSINNRRNSNNIRKINNNNNYYNHRITIPKTRNVINTNRTGIPINTSKTYRTTTSYHNNSTIRRTGKRR